MLKNNTALQGRKSLVASAVVTALSVSPLASFAEEIEKEQKEQSKIEVVTITAQKRVQNILKVPVSVGTVSDDMIKESGSILLSDVDKFIPGFDFSHTSGVTQAGTTMRGISSPNISVGGDPSSATFFDDIYMPRAAQNVQFSDMERIEVLKGPQGTLFGRNAAMGVVNMVPNSPIESSEAFVKATLGSDKQVRLEAMGNLALTDNVFIRANVLSNQQDGVLDNVDQASWNVGNKVWDLGEKDQLAARLALKWNISDATSFQVAYDYDDLEQAPSMAIGMHESALGGGDNLFASEVENDVRNGFEGRDMTAITAKLFHDIDEQWSLKYVVSKREWQTVNRQDEDGTGNASIYFDTSNNEDSDIFYTELQANYTGEKLHLVTGFSYSKENVTQTTELNASAESAARLITGGLNDFIRGQVAQQVAGQMADLGITSPEAQSEFVDYAVAQSGLQLDHMWNPNEWSHALNALGFADQIMGGLAMFGVVPPGTPLTPGIVTATGDVTYDMVAAELGMGEVFGPGTAGQFWGESINNTGDFTNWGIYLDADYAITDKWNIIGGIRYSKDSKDFTWHIPHVGFNVDRTPGIPAPAPGNIFPFPVGDLAASDEWSKVTGRLVTSYQLADNHMVFGSYSTGYKSGGFDSLAPSTVSIAPEDTANLEFGYKGILADSVVANVSAYYLELTNLQSSINSKLPGASHAVPTIINKDVEIKGLEIDLKWAVNDNLTLGLMTEFRHTQNITPDFYNAEGDLIDATTSKSKANGDHTLTLDYMPDINSGTLNFHMDYVFTTNINKDSAGLESYKLIPEYLDDRKNLDARISWTDDNERYEIGLWSHNITDNRYVESIGGQAAAAFGAPIARINRGREAGIDFKVNF